MMRCLRPACYTAILLLGACGGDGSTQSTGTSVPVALNTALIAGSPTLVLNIGGTSQGVNYDTLAIAGRAALSGNMQLHFTNGFRPTAGQSFVVVTAQGGISGTFGAVNADGIPVAVRYDNNSVTVTAS